jgi:hypothetical protein
MNEIPENDILELEDAELEAVSGGKDILKVRKGEVNIRAGAGKDYPVIAIMCRGDELLNLYEKKKDSRGKTWMKVRAVNQNGWVRSDLVK